MKKFLLSASCFMVLASFVSCLNDDNDDRNVYRGTFTISKQGDNYVLYGDYDVIVYPTAASVSSLTSGKGFGDNKRIELSFEYELANVESGDGYDIVRNAELKSGRYIQTIAMKLPAEAEAAKINVPDSIFPINYLDNMWTKNGYINSVVTGYYSSKNSIGIRPTVNLVVEYDEALSDTATLRLLYNRHSSKNESPAGQTQFITSHDAEVLTRVPGNDTISITVLADGINPKTLKVARKDLKKPAGV